jgi:hypothetical protein
VDEVLDPVQEYIIAADTRIDHAMDPKDQELLLYLYKQDILTTESLTNLTLKHWLSADYREPEKARG